MCQWANVCTALIGSSVNHQIDKLANYQISPMETLKEPLLAFISLFLSTLVGWLFGRRKQQAETQTTELDNVDKAIHIYRQMIDDLSQKYAHAIEELHIAQQRIKQLETTIENLLTQLKKYKT